MGDPLNRFMFAIGIGLGLGLGGMRVDERFAVGDSVLAAGHGYGIVVAIDPDPTAPKPYQVSFSVGRGGLDWFSWEQLQHQVIQVNPPEFDPKFKQGSRVRVLIVYTDETGTAHPTGTITAYRGTVPAPYDVWLETGYSISCRAFDMELLP
jgi:hypothetical protein